MFCSTRSTRFSWILFLLHPEYSTHCLKVNQLHLSSFPELLFSFWKVKLTLPNSVLQSLERHLVNTVNIYILLSLILLGQSSHLIFRSLTLSIILSAIPKLSTRQRRILKAHFELVPDWSPSPSTVIPSPR